jgi:two-component system, NtrC family, sensor histidine kinase AtoS
MVNPNIFSRWINPQKRSPFKLEDMAAVLDLLPQAALLVDWNDYRITLANALATELTAYMRSELVGMEITAILSSDDPDVSIKEALQTSSLYEVQPNFHITMRSGAKVRVKVAGLLDAYGKWILISLETEKQREQKNVEEQRALNLWQHLGNLSDALRKNDLKQALTSILETACLTLSADCAAIYQAESDNPMLIRVAEWGECEYLPQQAPPQELVSTQDTYIWMRRMHPVTSLQSQAQKKGMAYLACAPLGQFYARVGLIILAGKNPPSALIPVILPVIASFTATSMEMTTRVLNLEDEIEEKNYLVEAAEQLKDNIEDNLILVGADRAIFDFNRAAEQSLGYTSKEVFSQSVEKILICSERLEPLLTMALQGEASPELNEIKLYRRNGQAFAARLRIVPCQVSPASVGAAILFFDLSEKEQILQRNEQLEQRAVLGEVTASFAHEVRNPINNISTGLQLLELNLPEDDPNQENIKRLQQDCNRLTALIKSGLSFVRPMEYKMEPIQVEALLKNLLLAWKHRLDRSNVQYQLQVDPNLPQVEGDPRAMDQIFTNLINNAIDAMSDNAADHPKLLGVKAYVSHNSTEPDKVQISITDSGSGIPEDIRERIFEPFFTTKQGGTGIGLAIVKRIVTAHKGSIHVESVPGGTVFQVRLPVYHDKMLRI